MATYISMAVISILPAILYSVINQKRVLYDETVLKQKKKIKTFLIYYLAFCSFIPLFLVSAFRWDVGTDFKNYLSNYQNVIHGGNTRFEIGYNFFLEFLALFQAHPIWVFILTSLVFNILVFIIIYKYSPIPSLSILILLGSNIYFFSMTGIRQAIAVAICFFSIQFIFKKQPIKFIFSVIIATIFHKSALIALPLYLIVARRYTVKQYFVIVAITLVIALNLEDIVEYLFSLFAPNYLSPFNKSTKFVEMTKGNVIRFLLMLLTLFYARKLLKLSKNNIFLIHIQPLIFLTYFLIPFQITYRMVMYLEIFNIILIPTIIYAEKNNWKRIILLITMLLYYAYMFISSILNDPHNVLPYKTVFNM